MFIFLLTFILFSVQTSSGKGKKSPTSSIYISPLIQHDTDEESDQTDGINTSFSTNRYKTNLSTSISSISPRISSTIYNGHDLYTNSINKSRYSNEGGSDVSSNSNNNLLNASSESSTNGDHENDFTKRLLSLRNRNLGSALNTPSMIDTSKLLVFKFIRMDPNWNTIRNSNAIFFLFFTDNRFDRYSSPLLSYPSSRVSRYLNESAASRLSALSRDNSIVYQATNSNNNNHPRKPFSIRSTFSDFVNRQYERYSVKQSWVPCILLSALFVFFASVIIAYLTMNPDLSLALDASAAKYKLCPEMDAIDSLPLTPLTGDGPLFKSTINCIEKDQLEPAFDLLKSLIPELQKRIEYNRCKDSTAQYAMSAKEVIQYLYEIQQKSVIDLMRILHNAEYLITMNPQWRVGHFMDTSGDPASSISIANVAALREKQSNYFAIVKPRLPLTCFLYNKLQSVFVIIGWIVIVCAIVFVIGFTIRFIRSHLQTRRERVTNMVEEIKNVLMEKAYDPDTACTDAASVVINHLRDKLIPTAERNKMESVWNAALKIIENDSRVQFSVATRNGEDYRVMRWIDTVSPLSQSSHAFMGSNLSVGSTTTTSTTNSNSTNNQPMSSSTSIGQRSCATTSYGTNYGNIKKWQSPAFDKSNKIKDPPTECLKIRQMFDKHESLNPNLKQIIQDALLEKVAHTTCKIYDLQLDKQTCCVYVRCATAKDAGIIHDEVNGWWFDSRLVSIKFLRLDRYLSRFPNASSGPICLKPSNSKNLSMTNGDNENGGMHQNGKRNANSLTDYEDDDDMEN